MYWRLMSLGEIIQISDTSKSEMGRQVREFKNLTNGHQHTNTTDDEEVYVLNKCSQ